MRFVPSVPSFARARLAGWLLVAAVAPAGLCAQQFDGQISTLLAQAATAPVAQVFDLAGQLADLAPEQHLDSFRDALVRVAGKAEGARAWVCASLALRDLKADSTGRDLLELLRPVAEVKAGAPAAGDDDVRAAAMALLGDEQLYNDRIRPDVRKLVEANATNELVAPLVRIEASLALYHVGTDEQRVTAKRTLEQFLQSNDRDLKQRGALALAEINVEGGAAWAVLREIQHQPTDAGRRARLFVMREEDRRQFEQLLANITRNPGAVAATGADKDYAVLTELRTRIHGQHVRGREVTDRELIEYAAKGMLSGLDPHSTFFTSDEYQRFFFDLDREYGGIGAFVNFDQDGDFSIVRPIYSGPAYEAGLRSGDKILEVDGWETANRTSDEIIRRLKGRPESPVTLKWFRPGFQKPEESTIFRRQISVPAVNWAMVPGDIGYVELVSFSQNLSRELRAALVDLQQKGARGIVLDVRNNTGGFLLEARAVVEQFIAGKKLVVYTEGPAEPKREYFTSDRSRDVCTLPLAVLTNNFSASASEITAGALQQVEQRAVIIGERTFGKGTVQHPFPLVTDPPEPFIDLNGDDNWQEGESFTDRNGNNKYDPGAHVKLTVARYFLPNGHCPDKQFDKDGRVKPDWGVGPDKVLTLLEYKPEDAWKNAAVFALLKKGSFRDYVKKHLVEHEELFQQLAEGDGGDVSKYPGFAEFYQGLDTKLTEDDVRRWIRYELRDQISDLRGAVYPGQRALGDPQEDAQLQEAVRTLLAKVNVDIRDVPAYNGVLKIKFDEKSTAQQHKDKGASK